MSQRPNVNLIAERVTAYTDPLVIERMRTLFNHSLDKVRTKVEVTANNAREQYEWFKSMDWENVIIHAYRDFEDPWEIAGFSILRKRGDHYTPFFATNHIYHGRGIGRAIVKHYLAICPGWLRGEQLVSNGAIKHINSTVGWQILKTVDRPGIGLVDLLYHPGVDSEGMPIGESYPDYESMLDYWDTRLV
jgi:GNAT superfamily N-acetyltransferase